MKTGERVRSKFDLSKVAGHSSKFCDISDYIRIFTRN